jgi:hypothetical protein
MTIAVKHLSEDGYTEISAKSWGSVTAGTSTAAEKFYVWNVGDRALIGLTFDINQVSTGDGHTFAQWMEDTDTVGCPYGLTATNSAAGTGLIPSGTTYYYKMTGVNSIGESTGSLEVSATTSAASSTVTLDWTSLSGATGYKVYRSATSGSYGASSMVTTIVGGGTITYTDVGSAVVSGTVPTANTTAGTVSPYGTLPTSMGSTQTTIGTLAIGEQWTYWLGYAVGESTSETGNTRYAERTFAET